MSPDRITSVSSSTIAQLPLTTPFVPPPGCESHWLLTSMRTTGFEITDVSGATVLLSETVSSCFPSGFERAVPESHLHFSPAVCPSGMVYNRMQDPNNNGASTTAWCCNSDFEFQSSYPFRALNGTSFIPSNQCVRTTSNYISTKRESKTTSRMGSPFPTETVSWDKGFNFSMRARDFNISSIGPKETALVHEAWGVTWAASDRATLSLDLPDMTSGMLLPTWRPGDILEPGRYDTEYPPGYRGLGEFYGLVIGIPLGTLILIGIGIVCLFTCTGKQRKEDKMKAKKVREERLRTSAPATAVLK